MIKYDALVFGPERCFEWQKATPVITSIRGLGALIRALVSDSDEVSSIGRTLTVQSGKLDDQHSRLRPTNGIGVFSDINVVDSRKYLGRRTVSVRRRLFRDMAPLLSGWTDR